MDDFLFYVYLIDATYQLRLLCTTIFFLSPLFILCTLIFEEQNDLLYFKSRISKVFFSVFFGAIIFMAVVPSQQTMYLIASTKDTSKLTQTEAGKEAIETFNLKMKQVISNNE